MSQISLSIGDKIQVIGCEFKDGASDWIAREEENGEKDNNYELITKLCFRTIKSLNFWVKVVLLLFTVQNV